MPEPGLRDLAQTGAIVTTCHGCRRRIVWARTMAGPNGPGGKYMPLDPYEDPAGNVAVVRAHHGQLRARVLMKDETADRPAEYIANTHFATCPTGTRPELPPTALDIQPTRRRRRGPRR